MQTRKRLDESHAHWRWSLLVIWWTAAVLGTLSLSLGLSKSSVQQQSQARISVLLGHACETHVGTSASAISYLQLAKIT